MKQSFQGDASQNFELDTYFLRIWRFLYGDLFFLFFKG